jgi:DNA gyrase subunit B
VAYAAKDITVLKGLEPVRQRPGMYIGSTGPTGLHHLVYEIVDNSVDEAMAGYCTRIDVVLLPDGGCRVADDGRGMPVDNHPEYKGKSAAEVIMTVLHAGGKFGGEGYKISGGLHGVGASVTNALSNWLECEVRRDGFVWTVRYQKGKPVGGVKKGRALKRGEGTGTTVRWQYDPTIFNADVRYTHTTIEQRLREKAYLVRGLKFVLRWPGQEEQVFFSENGIADYVKELDSKGERAAVHSHVVYLASEDHKEFAEQAVPVEVALQWTAWNGKTDETERLSSFANVISTIDGGTHVEG